MSGGKEQEKNNLFQETKDVEKLQQAVDLSSFSLGLLFSKKLKKNPFSKVLTSSL